MKRAGERAGPAILHIEKLKRAGPNFFKNGVRLDIRILLFQEGAKLCIIKMSISVIMKIKEVVEWKHL